MLKKISRKRGFTLVEVLVAFVIFAIMAAMVGVILQSTMRVKQQNLDDAAAIEAQKQAYYQKNQPISKDDYDALKSTNRNDDVEFKIGGTDYSIDYVAADPFTGNQTFELQYYIGEKGNEPWNAAGDGAGDGGQGSDVLGGLNCGLYGSNGIESITVSMAKRNDVANRYYVFMSVSDNEQTESVLKPFQSLIISFPYPIVSYGYVNMGNGQDCSSEHRSIDISKTADGRSLRLSGNGSSLSIFNLAGGGTKSPFWVEFSKELTTEQLKDMTKVFGNSGLNDVTQVQKEISFTTQSWFNCDLSTPLYCTTFYPYKYKIKDEDGKDTDETDIRVNVFAATEPEEETKEAS